MLRAETQARRIGMKASNLALRLEDEPVVMAEVPRLARAVIAAEVDASLAQRPRRSLRFGERLFERRAIRTADQGLRLFRVR
jgi:hypothetical protein